MRKVDVIDNLDTINYIVQDCLTMSAGKEFTPRNGFVQGDGYAMDVRNAGTKNHINLHIRTEYLQDLCRIMISPKKLVVRYSTEFLMVYNPKTELYQTNLFDEPFTLEEMEGVFFTQNCVGGWGLQVNFNCDIMIKTLSMCRGIYDSFIFANQK